MYEPQRRVSSFDVDDGIGVRPALRREVLERPAVVDQCLLDGGLVQRGIHSLAEPRVAESVPRSVDADRRTVHHDADGLIPANEQPRFGI